MFQVNPQRVCLPVVALFALVSLVSNLPAQMTEALSFRQLVEKSDQIVVGQCVESKAGVQDGKLIVTQYKIKPSEFWKGSLPLGSDGAFTMTEYGGSLASAGVPLAQFAPGRQSDMTPGEDVLLFLHNPPASRATVGKPASPGKTTVALRAQDSPAPVGLWQGRYAVITHPVTGSRLLSRRNMTAVPGSPVNGELTQNLLKAQGKVVTTDPKGTKTVQKDANAKLNEVKLNKLSRQLDAAVKMARQDHEALAKRTPQAADEIYQLESIDSVKARVLRVMKAKNK